MKYGIYILAIFMAFSASLKSGYAMVSSFTVTQDTTRQVVVYFDREDTTVDLSYKNNNQILCSAIKRISDISQRSMSLLLFRPMVIRFIILFYLPGETIR